MTHHYTSRNGHYAVAQCANEIGVLAQVQNENGEQARVLLSPDEARHFAELLVLEASEIEKINKL